MTKQMHTQVGFDRTTKTYATAQGAIDAVHKTLAGLIEQGVVFNIHVVETTDPVKGRRFVPLLCCWRCPPSMPPELTVIGMAARAGFTCFA